MDSEDKGCFIIATILIILFFGAMMLNDWYKYDVDKKAIENGYIQDQHGDWIKPVEKKSP